jgi:hypothetical protein
MGPSIVQALADEAGPQPRAHSARHVEVELLQLTAGFSLTLP